MDNKPDFKAAGRDLKDELLSELDKRNTKVSGNTIGKIALRFNEGLDAKTTKTMKVKGLVTKDSLPRGFRVVTTTGLVIYNKEGEAEASDGESLIQWDEVDTALRVRTASDVASLYVPKAAQKIELEGTIKHDLDGRLERALELKKKNHGTDSK